MKSQYLNAFILFFLHKPVRSVFTLAGKWIPSSFVYFKILEIFNQKLIMFIKIMLLNLNQNLILFLLGPPLILEQFDKIYLITFSAL